MQLKHQLHPQSDRKDETAIHKMTEEKILILVRVSGVKMMKPNCLLVRCQCGLQPSDTNKVPVSK